MKQSKTNNLDLDDWLKCFDMQSLPDFDDKVQECEFFFRLLATEKDRNKFRWLFSAFLNAAYSFFESTALTAYFKYTDPDGTPCKDSEGLAFLQKHVKVEQNKKNPSYVKTSGLSPLTKQLYEVRKQCTHHFPLSIMITGPSLPDDFHIGNMRGNGIPAISLCHDTLQLIQSLYKDIDW